MARTPIRNIQEFDSCSSQYSSSLNIVRKRLELQAGIQTADIVAETVNQQRVYILIKNLLIQLKQQTQTNTMNSIKDFKVRCDQSSVVDTLLEAIKEITLLLERTPVIKLETHNKFGDQQLHLDVACDEVIEKHLKANPLVRGFASQERPEYIETSKGEGGYIVTFDPLDGSSIVDTNFAVGSIFSIWPSDESKLIGKKLGTQSNALLAIYGPRTTVLLYNPEVNKVQELTLMKNRWIVSQQDCRIAEKTNTFSPGNMRSASDNLQYRELIDDWVMKGYTLRYSGGMVPDIAQIFIRGNGVFSCLASKNHKAKLRVLYEVACVSFLTEKAGGKTITNGKGSVMDFEVQTYDDRMAFSLGSAEEIEKMLPMF